ncbi:hypothetical protein ACRAWG_10155 [Methylobacterium sp. P31]
MVRQEAVQVPPEQVARAPEEPAAERLPGPAVVLGYAGRVAALEEVLLVVVREHAAVRAGPGRGAAPAEPLSTAQPENVAGLQRRARPASAEARVTGMAQSGPEVVSKGLEKPAARQNTVSMEERRAARATRTSAAAVKARAPEASMPGAVRLMAP